MNNSKLSGLLFLVLFSVYGYLTGDIQLDFWSEEERFNARSLPYAISAAGVIVSLLLIMLPSADTNWRTLLALRWAPALQLLLTMSVYSIVFEYLGFIAGTLAFLLTSFVILGERRPALMLAAALPLTLGFWLLMESLGIYLSPGELFLDWVNGDYS